MGIEVARGRHPAVAEDLGKRDAMLTSEAAILANMCVTRGMSVGSRPSSRSPSNPFEDSWNLSMLLAQVGYTSGVKSGSTAAAGTETIPVRIPTKAIGHQGFEEYEGKTLSIVSVRHVTGFVKKKA